MFLVRRKSEQTGDAAGVGAVVLGVEIEPEQDQFPAQLLCLERVFAGQGLFGITARIAAVREHGDGGLEGAVELGVELGALSQLAEDPADASCEVGLLLRAVQSLHAETGVQAEGRDERCQIFVEADHDGQHRSAGGIGGQAKQVAVDLLECAGCLGVRLGDRIGAVDQDDVQVGDSGGSFTGGEKGERGIH